MKTLYIILIIFIATMFAGLVIASIQENLISVITFYLFLLSGIVITAKIEREGKRVGTVRV